MESIGALNGGEMAERECPNCHSKRIWKRGFTSNISSKQRYLCRVCETSFSEKSYKASSDINNRQLCALLKAKKLDTVTETKTVTEEGKIQQEAKGKILELLLYMKRQNYSDEYIRLNRSALNTLMNRGANLFDSNLVKDTIAKQKWSSNRKRNVINAYDMFVRFNKMTWEKPRIDIVQKIPYIPPDRDVYDLIADAPKKLSYFLLLLSETAMRRGEAKRLE
jgi:transposase-like protein